MTENSGFTDNMDVGQEAPKDYRGKLKEAQSERKNKVTQRVENRSQKGQETRDRAWNAFRSGLDNLKNKVRSGAETAKGVLGVDRVVNAMDNVADNVRDKVVDARVWVADQNEKAASAVDRTINGVAGRAESLGLQAKSKVESARAAWLKLQADRARAHQAELKAEVSKLIKEAQEKRAEMINAGYEAKSYDDAADLALAETANLRNEAQDRKRNASILGNFRKRVHNFLS